MLADPSMVDAGQQKSRLDTTALVYDADRRDGGGGFRLAVAGVEEVGERGACRWGRRPSRGGFAPRPVALVRR
jgi:hypothetical protein